MRRHLIALLMVLAIAPLGLVAEAVADSRSPGINHENTGSLVVVFASSPEALRNLVPAPLVPNEEAIMYLAINRSSREGIRFNEMILGVPVEYRGETFSFQLLRIVDDETIRAQDQAVWGVRKRLGRITLEGKDGKVRGIVETDGRVLVSAELEPLWPGGGPEMPPVIFVSGNHDKGKPDRHQLVWGTFENIKVHECRYGTAAVRFDRPLPAVPQDISIQPVCVWGLYKRDEFTLKPQGILEK